MAQVISTLCDECLETGEMVAADTYGLTVEVPGARPAPYVIDACEMHAKPYRDLLETLAKHGRRSDRKVPLPRTVTASGPAPVAAGAEDSSAHACPADGCDYSGGSVKRLRSHALHQHGTTLAELRGVAAMTCPAPGCGRSIGSGQGLSAHLRNGHGWEQERAREAVAAARG